jgi:hypothetical protein
MGAMPWQIIGPYNTDPRVALAKIQSQYLDHNYDLPATIANAVESAEACVAAVQDKDEYNLLETYAAILRDVKEIAREPVPDDKDSQIKLLRKIENARGNPLDNILDIQGVSDQIREWHVFPLPTQQIAKCFGTTRPSQLITDKILNKAYDLIDRAQAISIVLYRQRKPRRPVQIMYIGYTAD